MLTVSITGALVHTGLCSPADASTGSTLIYTSHASTKKDKPPRLSLLPQKNPMDYYTSSIYSFNTPDFTSAPVEIDNREVGASILSDKRTETKVR